MLDFMEISARLDPDGYRLVNRQGVPVRPGDDLWYDDELGQDRITTAVAYHRMMALAQCEVSEVVAFVGDRLPLRNVVFFWRYFRDLHMPTRDAGRTTYAVIGREHGLTPERVRQIILKAERVIRPMVLAEGWRFGVKQNPDLVAHAR
jgi:hypothetical protein